MYNNQSLQINFIHKYCKELDFIPPNILNYEETPEYKTTSIKVDKYVLTNLYKYDVDRALVGLWMFPYDIRKSLYILNLLIKNNHVHIYKIVFILDSILDNSDNNISNDFICYILHTINTNFCMDIKLDKYQFFWLLFILYKLRDNFGLKNNKMQAEFIQLLKNIYNKYFLYANFPLTIIEYINYIIKDLLIIYNTSSDNEKQLIYKRCKSIVSINNIDYNICYAFLSTVYNMSDTDIKSRYLLKII